jgi:hypothetical protein
MRVRFPLVGLAGLVLSVGVLTMASSAAAQGTAEGQQPAAEGQQPAAAAPAAPPAAPAVTLQSGAGMFFLMIKPDRTADFEWLVGRIKEAMLKSEDGTVKQQAQGIRVLRSMDPVPNSDNVMYVMMANPAVSGADYSIQTLITMLYKAFPEEQQDIYKRVQGAFGGSTNLVNLKPVVDFAQP